MSLESLSLWILPLPPSLGSTSGKNPILSPSVPYEDNVDNLSGPDTPSVIRLNENVDSANKVIFSLTCKLFGIDC